MSYLPKEQRRSEIIEAAIDVIQHQGLAAATVRNVAKATDSSPGQIHHHFESADALRAEALLCLWQRMKIEFLSQIKTTSPLETLIANLGGCAQKEDKETFAQLYKDLLEASRMSETMHAVLMQIMENSKGKYRELLKAAQDEGELHKEADIEKLSLTILALAFGFGFMKDIAFTNCEVHDVVRFQIDLTNRACSSLSSCA
nr:TetR family transcriptional regulator [uncultured Cohaesibacter sp.]